MNPREKPIPQKIPRAEKEEKEPLTERGPGLSLTRLEAFEFRWIVDRILIAIAIEFSNVGGSRIFGCDWVFEFGVDRIWM
jgi:hypothetical protein